MDTLQPADVTVIAADSYCGDPGEDQVRLNHIQGVDPEQALYDPNATTPTVYIARGHDLEDILKQASSR